MTLFDEAMSTKPQFNSNEEALEYYTKLYEVLGAKHGLTGYEFWLKAENSSKETDDYREIRSLAMHIGMAKYLIEKEKNG